MPRAVLIVLIVVLQAVPALAASTIDEVVARAVEQNPTLAAAIAEVRAARREWSAAASLPNLNITFAPGISGLGGTGEELLVTQPLGINGVPAARARMARFQTDAQRATALIELQDLVLKVRAACLSLHRARARLEAQRELLRSSQRFSDMARAQFEIGSRPEVDSAQARLELLRSKQGLVLAEADERDAVAELNALLAQAGAPPPDLVPLAQTVPDPPPPDEQMKHALAFRPEISLAEADRKTAEAQARVVRAEGNPDLVPQFRAFSVIRGFREYGIGVVLTLPLIDYGSRRNQARAADERAAANAARRAAAEQSVQREVVVARSQLTAATESLRVANEAASQSRRLLDAQLVGFGAGMTSVLSLLEAQRSWRYAELERIDALVGLHLARARLDRAMATLPDDLIALALRKERP